MPKQINPSRDKTVIHAIPNDLSPERILIDRELRLMLEQDGIDLHDIGEKLISQGYYYDPSVSETKSSWEEVGEQFFTLIQEGPGTPVMSTTVPLGKADYQGDELYVRELLPQTLCGGFVGLRLGDVVTTGVARIDDRRISEAVTCDQDYYPTNATRFVFAADLVELGPRPDCRDAGLVA